MRQGCSQNKTDLQCESNVSVQVRLVEGLRVRFVFHRTFQTACIQQHISLTFLFTIARYFSIYSDTVLEISCVSCVSLVFCLSVDCGWSICMSTVRDSSHGLPVHMASIHLTFSMYDGVEVSSCIPFCRPSRLYTFLASGLERLPCILPCICQRASRSVGLPIHTQ